MFQTLFRNKSPNKILLFFNLFYYIFFSLFSVAKNSILMFWCSCCCCYYFFLLISTYRYICYALFFSPLLIEIWYAVRLNWVKTFIIHTSISINEAWKFVCWKMQYGLMVVSCLKQHTQHISVRGGKYYYASGSLLCVDAITDRWTLY